MYAIILAVTLAFSECPVMEDASAVPTKTWVQLSEEAQDQYAYELGKLYHNRHRQCHEMDISTKDSGSFQIFRVVCTKCGENI